MKRIKVIVPIPMDEAGVAARAEQLSADFVHTADPNSNAICSQFTLLDNTNLWRVRDGKFQQVHVDKSGANVLV